MIFYNPTPGEDFYPKAALSAAAGAEVRLAHDERGFRVVLADGSDSDNAWASYSVDPQPSAPTVANWRPPVVDPDPGPTLTDVEIATNNFRQARLAAPAALDSLKGAVWAGLVAGGLAPDEATAAGVGLVLLHGPLLAAFEAAGGHPVAGAALYAAIASPQSVEALPWLKPEILGIFAAALTPK